MHYGADATQVLMKQKHRMIWERRHGKVGKGMRHDEPFLKDGKIVEVGDLENPYNRKAPIVSVENRFNYRCRDNEGNIWSHQ